MGDLDLLTLEDLVDAAEEHRENARVEDKIAGWDRLLEVLRDLAGGWDDAGVFDGRVWQLTEVGIENFQGVVSMPRLVLDPTPGVTVLVGDNGSGKSSIAEAVETALYGEPRAVSGGSGGNASLWDRQHCARDADEARVEVTLSSGTDRLILAVRLGSDGRVRHRHARLHDGAGVADIDLDTTPWASALAASRPVFGYAAIERQVQRAKDLQTFIEPLLGIGGCLDELKEALADRSRASTDAAKRWDEALIRAQQTVTAVDRQHRDGGADDSHEITWPTIDDDPDAWLIGNGLTEVGDGVEQVTEEHRRRLDEAAAAIEPAVRVLENAEHSVLARLAGPLTDLSQQASRLDDPFETCPVCASIDPSWAETLRSSLDGLVGLRDREGEVRARLADLRDRLDDEFGRVVAVLDQEWFDKSVGAAATPIRDRCRELRDLLARDGLRATPDIRAAAVAASTALRSEAWAGAVEAVMSASDRHREWLRARRAAVIGFVDVWRATGSEERSAASWREAQGGCFRTLQNRQRASRADALRATVDTAVQRLLHDVGLTVKEVAVQGT